MMHGRATKLFQHNNLPDGISHQINADEIKQTHRGPDYSYNINQSAKSAQGSCSKSACVQVGVQQ